MKITIGMFIVLVVFLATASAVDVDNGGAGDGMSDIWQALYGVAAGDTTGDGDGDGYTNEEESLFRSDPGDADSPGPVVDPQLVGANLNVEIDTILAVRYRIQYSTTLAGWTDCPQILEGDGTTLNFDVSACAPTTGERFFVRILPIDPVDADGDSLDLWEEAILNTSDSEEDSDSDRVGDLDEYLNGLDPTSNISNDPGGADALPDDWEIFYFGNLTEDESGDGDGDLIKNEYEFLAGLDPTQDNLTSGPVSSSAQYDPDGRLTTFGPAASGQLDYEYDGEGNIKSVSQP